MSDSNSSESNGETKFSRRSQYLTSDQNLQINTSIN